MPFPGDLHLVTVSGTILHPDGTAATGTVVFQMPYPLKDTTGHVVVGNTPPIVATLVSGAFSVQLPATDQSQINPINWAYLITVATDAAQYVFQAQLPTSPSSTTLDALIPLVTPPTPGVYVPLTYIAAANGVASLDSGGHVPIAQLPAGSGVLTVTATDSTITIGGTSQNPTVGVNAIAESRVTNLVSDLAAKVSTSRQVTAGAGLSGGGDLTADRTLAATDATTGAKGIVQLAGDLAGTAAAPTVPGLASKVASVTAADGTIVIGGTATAPTVGVGSIAESKVTNLVTDLAAKYVKPGGGIPKTDLAAAVQTSLGLADTSLQTAPADRYLAPLAVHSANVPFTSVNAVSTINNEAWFGKVVVRAGSPLAIAAVVRSAAAATHNTTGNNGFAIWNASASSLLWSSASDDLMWEATGLVSKSITGIATPTVDTTFWVAVSARGYSVAAEFGFVNLSSKAIFGDFYARYKGGGYTSWPASFNPATDLTTGSGFVLPVMIG